jgi:hypothetical protein
MGVWLAPFFAGKGDLKKGMPDRPHCKDKIPKFRNKYSQKRNIGVSFPISNFMPLWEIYIFPRSVCLFCWRKYVDRSCDYINRSQTNKCWNWGWGRAPRKGIHKWDFRCSAAYQLELGDLADVQNHMTTNKKQTTGVGFLFHFVYLVGPNPPPPLSLLLSC